MLPSGTNYDFSGLVPQQYFRPETLSRSHSLLTLKRSASGAKLNQKDPQQPHMYSLYNRDELNKPFKKRKPFEERKAEVDQIRRDYPKKVPLIIERYNKELSLPRMDKIKFLVPQELTMSQFVNIVRGRLALNSNQAFYLLINNRSLASLSLTLAEVYQDHKDKDGFLYMTYASHEMFG